MRFFLFLLSLVLSFSAFAQNDYSLLVHLKNDIIAYHINHVDSLSFLKSDLVSDSLYHNTFVPFDTEGTYSTDSVKCNNANHVVKALYLKNKPKEGHKYVLEFYSDYLDDNYQLQIIDYDVNENDYDVVCQSTGLVYKYDICSPLYDNADEKNIVGYAYLTKNNHVEIIANEGEGYDRLPYLTDACFTYMNQPIIQTYLLSEYNQHNKPYKIVVWGNSITWGSDATSSDKCYTAILRNHVKDYNNKYDVINCGVGGETCQSILVRQGAIGFYLDDEVVLPASSDERVEVQRMTNYINNRKFKNTYFRDESYFMLLVQGESGRDNPEFKTVNPIMINDIECTLSIEGDSKNAIWYLNRNENADSVSIINPGTFLFPSGTKIPTDILILAIGTNDGFTIFEGGKIDVERSIRQYLELVSLAVLKAGTEKYIVCSPYAGVVLQNLGEEGLTRLEKALDDRFGKKFFNTRSFINRYGKDVLLSDEVHPNDLGHQLIGDHLFDMLLDNGYLENDN